MSKERLRLVVGLGNPGREYEQTRHNAGFMVLDRWVAEAGVRVLQQKQDHQALVARLSAGRWGLGDLWIQKPLTFMNLSGQAVASLARFYKIEIADICVVHDELDLPFGAVRLKVGGGEGGHNGLKSMTQCLGSNAYSRIRMGIGKPLSPHKDIADYVLSPFSSVEQKELEPYLARGVEACEAFASGTFLKAMNHMNRSS